MTIAPMAGAVRLLSAMPEGTWAVATSGPRTSATARLERAGLPVPSVLVCAEGVVDFTRESVANRSVSLVQVARVGYWQDPVLVLRADSQMIWPPHVPCS